MTPRNRIPAALLAVLTFVLIAGTAPAAAHGGEGELTVEAREPQEAGFRYVVRLVWTDDGHAALDATVTATAIDASGTPQTPVTLNAIDQDGRYAAVVPSPAEGPYTVRFTAVTPEASTEITQQPPPPPTTTATTEPASPATASQATTTTTKASEEKTTDGGEDDDDSGNSSILFFFFAAAAVALIAVPIVLQRRRSSP